jgi:hypothetical protein
MQEQKEIPVYKSITRLKELVSIILDEEKEGSIRISIYYVDTYRTQQ